MSAGPQETVCTVIPGLRYRDANAAIAWLERAFGFQRRMVVPGENNTVLHAELVFGNGMVMLGSVRDDDFGKLVRSPQQLSGANTSSVYVVVQDADAHYARAKAAGAEIEMDIHDEHYGGRGYCCRDLEGHLWYFGTFDPWAQPA